MKYRMIIGLVVALALVGCKTKELIPSEYVKWMKDPQNGLREEKTIGDYTFTLQYKTSEFVILQQYKSDSVLQSKVEAELGNYSGMEYYTFEIRSNDGHDLLDDNWHDADEIASRVEYLLSYAQEDFSLVTGSDTIPCALYHFERNYSLQPVTTVVMGFTKPKIAGAGDRTLVFNDRLLGSGPVMITISEEDILSVPAIKYAHHE